MSVLIILHILFIIFPYSIQMGCAFNQQLKVQTNGEDNKRLRLTTVDCRRRSTKVVDLIVQNVKPLAENLTQQQINFCIKYLKEHPLFSNLDQKEMQSICQKMLWMQSPPDAYLFKQGEAGHTFFLIQKGKVSVEVDGAKVGELSEGQTFGQLALLFRTSRAASIKCDIQGNRFFVMMPSVYKAILRQLKTAQYAKNKELVQRIGIFQCLTNKQKFALSNSFKQAKYKENETIFQTGEVSQGIYIISEGLVQLNLPDRPPLVLNQLQVFGQSALKEEGRRHGQAKAKTEVKCLTIGKKDIEKALGFNLKNLIYFNSEKWALLRSKEFNQLDNQQLNRIVLGFECIQKMDGQKIEGDQFQGLVIGLQGGINNQLEGTLFNVQNWGQGKPKCETLVKNGKGCIGFLAFDKLDEIMKLIQNKKRFVRASQRCIAEKDESMNISDFQVVRKLGEGQFGQVFLVKNKKASGELYAVKCLSKKAVKQQQMEASVIEQKKILQKAIFPYIVGFVKAFHDKENIFLLMEYLKGKQMFEVIREMPTLNKPIARYFFGCILLAIEYLHMHNIIYRDVKPENSVIDNHGKVYLIDMGTAKELNGKGMFKTFTIIGTPHYMAPEVFQGKGYSFQSDYWSLGILLYEFVCGKLPFGENVHSDPYSLYALIKKSKLEFPKYMTDQKVKSLISFMLVKDPKHRVQQVSFEKIKRHEYFEGFSWQDLLQERFLPPYIPRAFRSGKVELNESTGQSFISHLYGKRNYGTLQTWSDQNVF